MLWVWQTVTGWRLRFEKSSDQVIADEAEAVASTSENHANVGACEVLSFKEERLAADLGERI